MGNLTAQLNAEQLVAVSVREGAYCCVAGPGSGKTRVIVTRLLQLVAEGYFPVDMLSLTFTREAAGEMRKRARVLSKSKVFRTFHSWALDFAVTERENFPFHLEHFPLMLPQQSARICGGLAREFGVDYKELRGYISLQKRRAVSPAQALEEELVPLAYAYAKAYGKYEQTCREQGLLDFDSLCTESVALLEENTEVRARWQYRWIQCDEAQDCDKLQWRLLQLLTEKHGNLFSVGDPNQAMYEWRGASPDSLVKFLEYFPSGKFLFLGQNYRSSKAIVEFCREIAPVKAELHTDNERGSPPVFRRYIGEIEEARGILSNVRDPNNEAALARTNRQLRWIEEVCMENNVRYRLLGKSGFWNQAEVRNLVSLCQLAAFGSDGSVLAAIHCPYAPMRGLAKKELIEWLKAQPSGKSYLQLLPEYTSPAWKQRELVTNLSSYFNSLRVGTVFLRAEQALEFILRSADVLNYHDTGGDEDNEPVQNILELVRTAGRYASLGDFLAYVDRARRASYRVVKGFTISTIHQAKGKEWDAVYVAGVNEGLLPHRNGALEEEKRIFFVACSRAAHRLTVSCYGVPSSFIKQYLPDEKAPQDIGEDFLLVSRPTPQK